MKRARIGFFAGLGYPLRGARFVYREHRGLARLWVPPIVLTAAALAGAAWAGWHFRAQAVDALWAPPQGTGWLASFERELHSLLEWVMAVVLWVTGLVAVALGTSVIAAPFNDGLSAAVERLYFNDREDHATLPPAGQAPAGPTLPRSSLRPRARGEPSHAGHPTPPPVGVLRSVAQGVGLELRKLALYAVVMGPLFVLSLALPSVLTLVDSAVGFGFTALFLALDYTDWPASRRGLPPRVRLGMARAHPRALLGLGLGIWVLLFVPLLNLLFMPAAVAGATLLFCDLYGPAKPPSR